jgi:hypothetical protein
LTTAVVRQFLVRTVVLVNACKSVQYFGPYGWTLFPLLDLGLATVGLDSGALITRANNTAARPPVFGVIVSVWVVFVSVATADESTWLLLAIACVRIVWGCVHKWREVKG